MPFDLSTVDAGATAWVLASAALVLLMTPGLAFFYGGMVRAKNVLGMLMQNFACIGIVSVVWVLVIATASPSAGATRISAASTSSACRTCDQVVPGYRAASPRRSRPSCSSAFQLMFAVITPALITGSTADRWKFGAFVVVRHHLVDRRVRPGRALGVLADRLAVQARRRRTSPVERSSTPTPVPPPWRWRSCSASGAAGRRSNFRPHNVPFVLLGAGLLWFGWFGFNAGSALGANNLAGYAFVNTNTATAAALLAWLVVEKIRDGQADHPGCRLRCGRRSGRHHAGGRLRQPDRLDLHRPHRRRRSAACAVGLKYKLGSTTRSTSSRSTSSVASRCPAHRVLRRQAANSLGTNGVFYGGGWSQLLGKQALAVGAVVAYSFVATLIIALVHQRGHRQDADDRGRGARGHGRRPAR